MSKIKLIGLVALSALTLSSSAFAYWTNGLQTVDDIIWRTDLKGFYTNSHEFHDPKSYNCGDKSNLYIIDPNVSEKHQDQLYSMLLLAFSTGKKVHVWTTGCSTIYIKFDGLQINN